MAQLVPPQLCKETVTELVLRSFPFRGVDVSSVMELDSYDDRNYYFNGVLERCDHATSKEYILKIWKSSESYAHCEGRSLLLKYLRECGDNVPCPWPVRCKEGNYTVECSLVAQSSVANSSLVTVQEYLPGTVMEEVDPPPYLLFELGKAVGNISRNLQVSFNCRPHCRKQFCIVPVSYRFSFGDPPSPNLH